MIVKQIVYGEDYWLGFCGGNRSEQLKQIKLAVNTYSTTYENFLLLGDFNITTENSKL